MTNIRQIFVHFLVTLLAVQGAIAAQLLFLPSARADSTPGDKPRVVINEIMWAGSSLSTADEWIELYNPGTAEIDIGGWELTSAAIGDEALTIPGGYKIPAGEYFLIANFAKTDPRTVLDTDPNWVTTGIQLDDQCDPGDTTSTTLLDQEKMLVDSAGCGAGGDHPVGKKGPPMFSSMERKLPISDGMSPASWQTSLGFVNLKIASRLAHTATPGFTNDSTGPTGGFVNDGDRPGIDIDWTAQQKLDVSWGGFEDKESGLSDDYLVAIGTTAGGSDVKDFAPVTGTTFTFSDPSLVEDVSYFATVRAFNGVGILSDPVSSDGQRINSSDPIAPTNGRGEDVPNDNGGSVSLAWDSSVSLDVVGYEIWQRVSNQTSWTDSRRTGTNSIVISGLESGRDYQFAVTAVDFNGQKSDLERLIITARALDNLAPILNRDRVSVQQNHPGTADSISGAAGAVNERSVVNILDRNPSLPGALVLGAVESLDNGSFPAVAIGDNRFGSVWVQLIDREPEGLTSVPASFTNDIIAPDQPVLERVVSDCREQANCRIEISWRDSGPDSATFVVAYLSGGTERRTVPQRETSLVLDLATDRSYDFSVYAIDAYGNISQRSNVFFLTLNRGVRAVAFLVDGQQRTEVTAIAESVAIARAPLPITQPPLIPVVRAEEPAPPQPVETETKAADQDWDRIFAVVIILIAVAGGLYLLSRSFRGGKAINAPEPKPERTVVTPSPQEKPTETENKNKKGKKSRR